jgi:hypothetical protein
VRTYVARIAPRPLLLVHAGSADAAAARGARALFDAAGEPKQECRIGGDVPGDAAVVHALERFLTPALSLPPPDAGPSWKRPISRARVRTTRWMPQARPRGEGGREAKLNGVRDGRRARVAAGRAGGERPQTPAVAAKLDGETITIEELDDRAKERLCVPNRRGARAVFS